MTNLFQYGDFVLHSGAHSKLKIDCDALSDEDWQTFASIIASKMAFRAVEGVPEGGLKLAHYLRPYQTPIHRGMLLIVDDVLTTGTSMEVQRRRRKAAGVVVFARGPCPAWVAPIFKMTVGV